jgi:molecular chaperone DnaK (HSP70)
MHYLFLKLFSQVSFNIDRNGILLVTAVDLGTGNKKSIEIKNDANRLTPSEIRRMSTDAEKYKDEGKVIFYICKNIFFSDARFLKRAETRNELEHACYTLRRELNDDQDPLLAQVSWSHC